MTSYTKTAIERSIAGHWKGEGARFNAYEPMFRDVLWYLADGYAENCSLEEALLDPKFWAALGKTEGWYWKAYLNGKWETEHSDMSYKSDTPFRLAEWEFHMDGLMPAIRSGINHEEYFKQILK